MSNIQNAMCEIHSIGRQTKERIIGLRGVPSLAEFGIVLAGVSEAKEGFSWSRLNPVDTQILAVVQGTGEVWAHGQWKKIGPGFAYVTPPGIPHAYRALPKEWVVCWVAYQGKLRDPAASLPVAPEIVHCPARQLWLAVEGACDAVSMEETKPQAQLWVRLIHSTVIRILNAAQHPRNRLAPLWNIVSANVANAWTLEELGNLAQMSKENLRRVCLFDHGVSPMRHLTRLRIARATELLAFSSEKLAAIAERVGYSDPFAFSVAFKRETGFSPSHYRKAK